MNKFIRSIVAFSLRNKFFIFFLTAVLVVGGVVSYLNTPIEAFPDVTNTQIIIVTQWEGRSAEEIERFVTIPIEVAMNSVQKKSNVRSITHPHVSAKHGSGGDVNMLTQNTVMIYGSGGVDDGVGPDAGSGLHDRPGHDLNSRTELDVRCH